MTSTEHHDAAKLVALGAASLFVGDLLLTWHGTDSSGWTGWGLVAGLLALVVDALAGARGEHPLAMLVSASGMVAATSLVVAAGDTHWPAWLGLALAGVAAAACLDAYRR